MEEKQPLFAKIFDIFAEPFASNRTLTSIETVLVTEESKSETIISRFRVVLSGLALIVSFMVYLNNQSSSFVSSVLPLLVYFIFSLGLMFKLSLIHSSAIYRQKYFLS